MTGSKRPLVPALWIAACFAAHAALADPPAAPPTVEFGFGSMRIDRNSTHLERSATTPAYVRYNNELNITAGILDGNLAQQELTAEDGVRVTELGAFLGADKLSVLGAAGTASAANAILHEAPLTMRAGLLQINNADPASRDTGLLATHVNLTTSPLGVKPDLSISARTIGLYPVWHRIIIHNAGINLFGHRLLTLPYLSFPMGSARGGGAQTVTHPSVGISGRDGFFVALQGTRNVDQFRYGLVLPTRRSIQGFGIAQQTLLQAPLPVPPRVPADPAMRTLGVLRQIATALQGPLPEGDPLRYHDFVPSPDPVNLFDSPQRGRLYLQEELAYRQAANGRRRDDLLVSRLPEVGVFAQVPLTPSMRPIGGMLSEQFRSELRRVRLELTASTSAGEFREDPTKVRDSRYKTTVGLGLQPLLIAPNWVIVPAINAATSRYSNFARSYSYVQTSLAVRRYFSDRSAITVQYLGSSVSGDSPFNFDVLDSTRELDLRSQFGSHQVAFGSLFRYDLVQHNLIDYRFSLAYALHGLTPVLQYDSRNRGIGLGVEIEGLTF